MNDRDCNRCLYATRDGGCASWDCNFISIAEAEPKRGRWHYKFADNGWQDVSCSECGYTENVDVHVRLGYNFCPNCGARMDKERK